MLNKLNLAFTFTVIGYVAACSSSSDPAPANAGDAGMNSSAGDGDPANGGDGDPASGGDGDASSAGDGDPAAGDGDPAGDTDAGAGSDDDASTGGGDGDDASLGTPGEGEGIFATVNGTDYAFTLTPQAIMQYPGADQDPIRVSMTAGGQQGDDGVGTFSINVGASGSDSLGPGTYECMTANPNTVQYIGPTFDTYQAVGGVGECVVELTAVGEGVGDHVTGTFTATLIKAGGGDSGMLEVTNGSFDVVRTQN
jgi:hypothetical protein